MATPRKHWFRVADSIAQQLLENDELAFLIRLMATMNTRWARNGLSASEACSTRLTTFDLMTVAGVNRVDAAMGVLGRLIRKVSISATPDNCLPGVYFARDGERVKIGKTMNPCQRIAALRKKAPGIELIGWLDTLEHSRVERELHTEYASIRIDGEWFRATEELLERARQSSIGSGEIYRKKFKQLPSVTIKWDKWKEFQALDDARNPLNHPFTAPQFPPPPPPPHTQTQVESNGVASAAVAAHARKKNSKPKAARPRSSACPEDLNPEQWGTVYAWRDREGHAFSDAELAAQWKLHANHFIGKGASRADWVRSFYNWLTGPYYKPATGIKVDKPKPGIETFDEAASRRNREWLLSLGGGK